MDAHLSGKLGTGVRVLLCLLIMGIARTAPAQGGSELFSFDIGVGPAIGSGRLELLTRSGAGFSVNASWRPARVAKRKAVLAVNSSGFYLPFDENTGCSRLSPDGMPPYQPCSYGKAPNAISIGVLGGIAFGADASAVRFMAGPAVFNARAQDTAIGLQSRVDFARPITNAVSFLMWAQGMVIPLSTENTSAKALQFGVGFRLR